VAAGEPLPRAQDEITGSGHAIEARLYAEDPGNSWAPGVGEVFHYRRGPGHARYEEAIATGSVITPHYDPMVAKVIVHRPTREAAAAALAAELDAVALHGPPTNRDFLVAALRSSGFLAGETTTGFIDEHPELLTAGVDGPAADAHLAAAVWDRVRRNRAEDVHWGFAPPGWRNVPSQPQLLSFGGTAVGYAATGDTITIGTDRGDITATITGRNPYLVEIDGVARRCAVARHGRTAWVNSSDGQTSFQEDPRFVVHDTLISGGGPTAPVPGTVVAVLVEVGDEVDDHTDLLVMEAMKMEHRIRAPGPAVVAEVLVAAGDQVEAGRLLIRLAELPE